MEDAEVVFSAMSSAHIARFVLTNYFLVGDFGVYWARFIHSQADHQQPCVVLGHASEWTDTLVAVERGYPSPNHAVHQTIQGPQRQTLFRLRLRLARQPNQMPRMRRGLGPRTARQAVEKVGEVNPPRRQPVPAAMVGLVGSFVGLW